jgi:predicted enzyme related to lactoylglutathione lyase
MEDRYRLATVSALLVGVITASLVGLGHPVAASSFRSDAKEAPMSQGDFRLAKVAVIMLGVRDLVRSTAFYSETLGLRSQGGVPGELAFFDAGGTRLALSAPLGDPKLSPHTVGALEVVFAVDDLTMAVEALRSRGVQFIAEPRRVTGENWSAVFTDPDGHRLSLFGPKEDEDDK